jgi:hypothetical protein
VILIGHWFLWMIVMATYTVNPSKNTENSLFAAHGIVQCIYGSLCSVQ